MRYIQFCHNKYRLLSTKLKAISIAFWGKHLLQHIFPRKHDMFVWYQRSTSDLFNSILALICVHLVFHQLSLGKYSSNNWCAFFVVYTNIMCLSLLKHFSVHFFLCTLFMFALFFVCARISFFHDAKNHSLWNWINGRILKPCLSLSVEWH